MKLNIYWSSSFFLLKTSKWPEYVDPDQELILRTTKSSIHIQLIALVLFLQRIVRDPAQDKRPKTKYEVEIKQTQEELSK